jgi:hypothetical protein
MNVMGLQYTRVKWEGLIWEPKSAAISGGNWLAKDEPDIPDEAEITDAGVTEGVIRSFEC